MKVLGLDLETQGLEDNTKITEVGAILAEIEDDKSGKGSVLGRLAKCEEFCYEADYPAQPEKIVELTGITDDMLRRGGNPRRFVLEEKLFPLIDEAQVIFIHNKDFDWRILEHTCKEIGINLPKKEVICTRADIDYGPEFSCRKLQHLCIDHKMHFNPKDAHRATFDVNLMLQLICHYKISDILKFAREPWHIYEARIARPWEDQGVQKNIAVKLGFRFEKIMVNYKELNFPKQWVIRTKESKIETIKKAVEESDSPFSIEEINQ